MRNTSGSRFRVPRLLLAALLCSWRAPVVTSADFLSFRREKVYGRSDESGAADDGCDCRPAPEHYATSSPSTREKEYTTVAYLVTFHSERTMKDALHLFRAIRSPLSLVAVHVDAKVPRDVFERSALRRELRECPCGSVVVVELSEHSSEWGGWSMNTPTLWGMNAFVRRPEMRDRAWSVFVNLSADSLPVYDPHVTAHLFATVLRNTNFVTSSACETGLLPTAVSAFPPRWHKREAYPDEPTRVSYVDERGEAREAELEVRFGSQWTSLTRSFVEYLVDGLSRADSLPSRYADALRKRKRLMTDETFFATLLTHVPPFNETQMPVVDERDGRLLVNEDDLGRLRYPTSAGAIYALRYERMDEHRPTASGYFPTEQRYRVSDRAKGSRGVDDPRVWGPYFLGVYDLANLKASGALFARKVSAGVDPNLYKVLPVTDVARVPDVGWVDDVGLNITDPPDWERVKADAIRRATLKARIAKRKKHKIKSPSTRTTSAKRGDYDAEQFL